MKMVIAWWMAWRQQLMMGKYWCGGMVEERTQQELDFEYVISEYSDRQGCGLGFIDFSFENSEIKS